MTDTYINPPTDQRKTRRAGDFCVDCKHMQCGKSVSWSYACFHPSNEHDPVSGRLRPASCYEARANASGCGIHGLWFTQITPEAKAARDEKAAEESRMYFEAKRDDLAAGRELPPRTEPNWWARLLEWVR